MYLVTQSMQTKTDGRIYSCLQFDANQIVFKTYTEHELKELYNFCTNSSTPQIINIEQDANGNILAKTGYTITSNTAPMEKYVPTSLKLSIEKSYIWSIMINAISENAKILIDGVIQPIETVDCDMVNKIVRVNNTNFSPMLKGYAKELVLKYPESSKFLKVFYPQESEDYKLEKGNTIKFNLDNIKFSSDVNSQIKFIAPPFSNLMEKIVQEYKYFMEGFLMGARLLSLRIHPEAIKAMPAFGEDVSQYVEDNSHSNPTTKEIKSALSELVPDKIRVVMLLKGIKYYTKYGSPTDSSIWPTREIVYTFMLRELFVIRMYLQCIWG